jgi:hypothetical protein
LHPTEKALLDELGDLDPVEIYADNADHWVTLIDQAGQLVCVQTASGEWSALDILAHLVVVEITNGLCYRAMLVQESPDLPDFDAGAWASVLRTPGIQALALLRMFRALRADTLVFWGSLDAAARARVGIHSECGPESIELRFRMLAGHDIQHLAQARRTVALVRAMGPGRNT